MIAIIGYGKHVKNTVIPALSRADIKIKYILVREVSLTLKHESIEFTHSLQSILDDIEVTHIYIATPLSTHYHFTKLALSGKKNVLCEKPLSNSLHTTEELFTIARASDVFLDEMVMFSYHQQFIKLKEVMKRPSLGTLLKLTSCFQVPHLEKDNIRYDKTKDGGALFDIGFYPIAANLFLLENCEFSSGKIFSQELYDVDLTGTALFYNKGGVCGVASWGLGALYKNYIRLEYSDAEIIINRAFSKPFDLKTEIAINTIDGSTEKVSINPDDHFAQQFLSFMSKIKYDNKSKNSVIERISVMTKLIKTLDSNKYA
jgi:NDP-hexose-3-ketoreductase